MFSQKNVLSTQKCNTCLASGDLTVEITFWNPCSAMLFKLLALFSQQKNLHIDFLQTMYYFKYALAAQ
jgi:hypothetical protein